MGIVRLTGRLICADAAEARIVADHLPEHVRLSRAEPGCLRFDATPTDDPLIWQIDEAFANEAAFEAHQTRNRASVWWEKSRTIRRDFTKTIED
jgi:quinol monooxygenase YgiN